MLFFTVEDFFYWSPLRSIGSPVIQVTQKVGHRETISFNLRVCHGEDEPGLLKLLRKPYFSFLSHYEK